VVEKGTRKEETSRSEVNLEFFRCLEELLLAGLASSESE